MRGWFPPILALMLAACTQPPELNQPDTRNLFAPGTSAVVEPSVLTNATCGRLGIPDRGVWTSTSAQVIELEEVLLERLKAELVRDAEEFGVNNIAPSDYLRRYAGIASANDRQLIAICGELRRFYEEGSNWSWPDGHIPLRDGGSSTFGGLYDPETEQITYFSFGYVG